MNTCDFSPDRQYRYTLTHAITPGFEELIGSTLTAECVFIGLNPSTADEQQEDPTIRRCIGYANTWGYDVLTMLNIFAYRSTNPKRLYRHYIDPIGPDNDRFLVEVCQRAQLVVCAWGAHGSYHNRAANVRSMLQKAEVVLHYLKLVGSGQPGHPLYLPGNLEPTPWLD